MTRIAMTSCGTENLLAASCSTWSFGNRKQAGMKHWCIAIPLVLLLGGCEARYVRPTIAREPPEVAAPGLPEVKQFEWGLGKIVIGMTKDEVLHQIKETWKRPNGDVFADQGVIVPGVSEPPPSSQEGDHWELRYGEGSGAAPGGGAITLVFEAERLIQIVVGMVSA